MRTRPGLPIIRDLVLNMTNLRCGSTLRLHCRTIMNCAEVCPKDLDPSHAIEKIRLMMATLPPDPAGLPTHRPDSAK